MGSQRNVDMNASTDKIKVVKVNDGTTDATPTTDQLAEDTATKKVKLKKHSARSKKYVASRSQVDKTKLYDPFAAIEMLKKLSYSKFDGTITADLLMQEIGNQFTLTFPHATGKQVRVAITSEELLADIEAGKIEFDVLISSPEFVPKLAKHARVLGPKGLMPNPKNGTITQQPEEKKKELEGGQITLKTEKKQPVMHVMVGKVTMETKNLVENVQTLLEALGTKLVKMTLSASMSPGIKVKIS